MMVDGKYSDDTKANSDWVEPTSYCIQPTSHCVLKMPVEEQVITVFALPVGMCQHRPNGLIC